jgi:hypothetical protein
MVEWHGTLPKQPAGVERGSAAGVGRHALDAMWTDLPLFVVTTSYVTVACIVSPYVGGRPVFVFSLEGLLVLAAFACVAASASMWRLLRAGNSMTRVATWRHFGARFSWRAVFRYASACALIWPFLDALGWFKSNIGRFSAYRWDPLFASWDKTLHFGRNPGDILALGISHPTVIRLLDWLYHPGWVTAFVMAVLWFGFVEGHPTRRMQVLLSCALVWIVLGTVLATAFASVGPCYYGTWVPGADPFAPLMAELRDVHRAAPLFSIQSQKILWAGFTGHGVPLGVSAMPSVHVGLTAVMALALKGRWRGVGAVFLVAILVGSVRLGWHYAIDGYVSVIVVAMIWSATGRFARWWCAIRYPVGKERSDGISPPWAAM